MCHWLNKHLSHPSIFLFRLDFLSSFSSPRRGRRKRGADSFPERQLVIEPTFCIASNTFMENKTCGFKVFRSKTPNYDLQFLFHSLQENISSLGCKNCILSCSQSFDKWLPLFSSYMLLSLDLWSLFLNFNKDKVKEIFTFLKSKA